MLIPIVRDLVRTGPLQGSKLYMPISFASVLGGTCTLIGTSVNIIIGGMILDTIAQNAPGTPPIRALEIFDPAWVAVPAAVLGIALMILGSRFLFPAREEEETSGETRLYRAEFVVAPDSPLVGRSLADAGFTGSTKFQLLSCRLPDASKLAVESITLLQPGQILAFSADADMVGTLWSTPGLRPRIRGLSMESERHTRRLVEVVVAPTSVGLGRQLSELPLPDTPYHLRLVATSRGGRPLKGPVGDQRIEVGDNAIIEVDDAFFYVNRREQDFSLSKTLRGYQMQRLNRAVTATLITLSMVAVVALGLMSMLNAAMLATGAMLLTGCMSLRAAGRSVDFATLFVLAGAIGLAAAVTQSGLAQAIAEMLIETGGSDPYVALAVVFVARSIMANLITNAASAVFMYPIALSIATQLGVSFMPFVIALMTGTVGSLITPSAYQTNLMVYGPGNYQFSDFMRAGIPLTILVGVVTVILAPLAFGF